MMAKQWFRRIKLKITWIKWDQARGITLHSVVSDRVTDGLSFSMYICVLVQHGVVVPQDFLHFMQIRYGV